MSNRDFRVRDNNISASVEVPNSPSPQSIKGENLSNMAPAPKYQFKAGPTSTIGDGKDVTRQNNSGGEAEQNHEDSEDSEGRAAHL